MCLIKSNVLPAITKVSAAGMCSLTLEYFFCGFHVLRSGWHLSWSLLTAAPS